VLPRCSEAPAHDLGGLLLAFHPARVGRGEPRSLLRQIAAQELCLLLPQLREGVVVVSRPGLCVPDQVKSAQARFLNSQKIMTNSGDDLARWLSGAADYLLRA